MEFFYNNKKESKKLVNNEQNNEKLEKIVKLLEEQKYDTNYFKETFSILTTNHFKNLYRFYKIEWNNLLKNEYQIKKPKMNYQQYKNQQLLFTFIDIGLYYKRDEVLDILLNDMIKFLESEYNNSSDFIYFTFKRFLKKMIID